MLREIGDPAKAEAFVEARLGTRGTLSRQQRTDPKPRMPGFGHRVYRVDDARARVLARHGQVDGRGHRAPAAVRGGRARLRHHARPHPVARERRLLLGRRLRRAEHPARPVHVDLRHRPRRRLVRSRPRAVRRQPSHPPAGCTTPVRSRAHCRRARDESSAWRATPDGPRGGATRPSIALDRDGRETTAGGGERRLASARGYGCFLEIAPQAMRAPEFPVGSVRKSSGAAWMTSALPLASKSEVAPAPSVTCCGRCLHPIPCRRGRS